MINFLSYYLMICLSIIITKKLLSEIYFLFLLFLDCCWGLFNHRLIFDPVHCIASIAKWTILLEMTKMMTLVQPFATQVTNRPVQILAQVRLALNMLASVNLLYHRRAKGAPFPVSTEHQLLQLHVGISGHFFVLFTGESWMRAFYAFRAD